MGGTGVPPECPEIYGSDGASPDKKKWYCDMKDKKFYDQPEEKWSYDHAEFIYWISKNSIFDQNSRFFLTPSFATLIQYIIVESFNFCKTYFID